jgi:pimeloyl-ACP methyl ester carboxylesterase
MRSRSTLLQGLCDEMYSTGKMQRAKAAVPSQIIAFSHVAARCGVGAIASEDLLLESLVVRMGHSGGTFIGVQVAARAPELYEAYIGVAQMSN